MRLILKESDTCCASGIILLVFQVIKFDIDGEAERAGDELFERERRTPFSFAFFAFWQARGREENEIR